MDAKAIDIKAESFPWQAHVLGVFLAIVGFSLLLNYWWASALLLLAAVAIFTGRTGTIINLNEKTFTEYTSFLFYKNGTAEKFNGIERIFINSGTESETFYTAHTMQSSSFMHEVYNAYLKFDNGKKIFLTSRKNKAKLLKMLQPVTYALQTQLVDYSVPM